MPSTIDSKPSTIDSERFGRAAARAAQWHATQKRKGSETPYLCHLLGVASLVLEDGGDEVWKRFKGGREGFLWYNEQLHAIFTEGIPASRSLAAMAEGLQVLRAD